MLGCLTAIQSYIAALGNCVNMDVAVMLPVYNDRCEIRTRATEVTGALNQRLRPLGQPALTLITGPVRVIPRE